MNKLEYVDCSMLGKFEEKKKKKYKVIRQKELLGTNRISCRGKKKNLFQINSSSI